LLAILALLLSACGTEEGTAVNPPLSVANAALSTAPTAASVLADTTESSDEVAGITYTEAAGGAKNIIRLTNRVDNRLRVKGNVQLNRIPGPTVAPGNISIAYSSCTDCQTLTMALQINLYERGAANVSPQNAAVALNYACTRCVTAAWAAQYTIPVDDPTQVPAEVSNLIKAMDSELRAIHNDQSVTLDEALTRLNAVKQQFAQLGEYLQEQRQDATETTSPGATAAGAEDVMP
jgi:putative peptide zinc metalloprotease protein